jgi:hypothetical protein
MWAYEEDAAYMEPLIVGLRHVLGAHLVVLTTDPPVMRDRYEAHPDRYFSASRVLAANERFTRLPLLMPPEVKTLHLDTGRMTVEQSCA